MARCCSPPAPSRFASPFRGRPASRARPPEPRRRPGHHREDAGRPARRGDRRQLHRPRSGGGASAARARGGGDRARGGAPRAHPRRGSRRVRQGVHEAHGVRFNLSARPRAIDRATSSSSRARSIAADLVIMGVGVRPRTRSPRRRGSPCTTAWWSTRCWSRAPPACSPRETSRDIPRRASALVRIEHWVVAQRQGQAAARAMLGLGQPFRDVPFFWSLHHDVNLGYIGHAPSGTPSRCAATSRRATRSSSSARRAGLSPWSPSTATGRISRPRPRSSGTAMPVWRRS